MVVKHRGWGLKGKTIYLWKVAVQIDIGTFEKIENILEDHGLFKLIQEDNEKEYLNLSEAKEFYKGLDKANWKLYTAKSF